MTIELIQVPHKGQVLYAGVDNETGESIVPFTQFIIWFSLGKSVRKARVRGLRPTSRSIRQYAYRLKMWFDFIYDWNSEAEENQRITWRTALYEHMELFSELLKTHRGTKPGTRNGLRVVWELFYEEFCPYMDYSHTMLDLSELVIVNNTNYSSDNNILGGRSGEKLVRKSLSKEPENVSHRFKVISLDDMALLIKHFDDFVFAAITYFMATTGLRIGGALQVPYPDTDPNNPYISTPILIIKDYNITDGYFTFNYINKGHEEIGDFQPCDVPFYAWEDIWNAYHPMLEKRLVLWRKRMVEKTGNQGYNLQLPQTFWLDKNGKEVVNTDVWTAFRQTVKTIQLTIRSDFPDLVPQMLRHTYAAMMVIEISEVEHIELNPNNKATLEFIHGYLQEQLGHKSRATTLKYIKTALSVVKRRWIPKIKLPNGKFGIDQSKITEFRRILDFGGARENIKKQLPV